MHTSRKEKEGSIETCGKTEFWTRSHGRGQVLLDTPGAWPLQPRVPGHRHLGVTPAHPGCPALNPGCLVFYSPTTPGARTPPKVPACILG